MQCPDAAVEQMERRTSGKMRNDASTPAAINTEKLRTQVPVQCRKAVGPSVIARVSAFPASQSCFFETNVVLHARQSTMVPYRSNRSWQAIRMDRFDGGMSLEASRPQFGQCMAVDVVPTTQRFFSVVLIAQAMKTLGGNSPGVALNGSISSSRLEQVLLPPIFH
jgi:hypothetical protein